MSFKKYKIIDLAIFTGLYLILESLISFGANKWFVDQPYVVSIMLPMLLIVIMRWDYWGFILALISAPFYVLLYHGAPIDILVYLLGSIALMGVLFFLLPLGKEKVRKSFVLTIVYILIAYLLLEVFRGFGAMIFKQAPIEIIWNFIWTDALSFVFSLLVILIARKLDGVFEDQKTYCFRKQKEREEELKKSKSSRR